MYRFSPRMAKSKKTCVVAITSVVVGVAVVAVVLSLTFTVWLNDDTETRPEPGPCDRGDGHDDYIANGTDIAIDENVNAYLVEPTDTCLAAVIVVHDIYGYELGATRLIADELASHGYTAIMPDLFRGNPWNGTDNFDLNDFMRWRRTHPQERIDEDIDVTLLYIHDNLGIENVGFIGFCFGGQQTVLASIPSPDRIQAGVGFYGSGMTEDEVLAMQAPTLLIYAQNDTVDPVENVYKLEDALRDADRLLDDLTADDSDLSGPAAFIKIFDDVGHGFVHKANRSDPVAAVAAGEAKADMYYWLGKYLPTENNN